MEKELPQIDLPEEWIAGTDISRELLAMYANYPVRLKCEICVFCAGGEVEASLNLNRITVHACDFVLLPPGSIFQVHRVEGELSLYVLGFSEQFIREENLLQKSLDSMYRAFEQPVIHLKGEGGLLMQDYLRLLIRAYGYLNRQTRRKFAPNLYNNVHTGIGMMFRDKGYSPEKLSKNEQLCRSFVQLVMRHYAEVRSVAWYAEQLGITHAYLCGVVKQVTGRTCVDLISSVVIMDAKSQLKLTKLSVQAISDSLNFANLSFFGKYFKRYVGMTPLEYRNS